MNHFLLRFRDAADLELRLTEHLVENGSERSCLGGMGFQAPEIGDGKTLRTAHAHFANILMDGLHSVNQAEVVVEFENLRHFSAGFLRYFPEKNQFVFYLGVFNLLTNEKNLVCPVLRDIPGNNGGEAEAKEDKKEDRENGESWKEQAPDGLAPALTHNKNG